MRMGEYSYRRRPVSAGRGGCIGLLFWGRGHAFCLVLVELLAIWCSWSSESFGDMGLRSQPSLVGMGSIGGERLRLVSPSRCSAALGLVLAWK